MEGGGSEGDFFFSWRYLAHFVAVALACLLYASCALASVEDETWFIVSSRDEGTSAWWRRRKCARPGKKKPVEGEVD